MRPKERRQTGEHDLFRSRLDQIIDLDHAMVKLGEAIDWRFLERKFGEAYSDKPGHGASTDLLTPCAVRQFKMRCGPVPVMRSIPVTGDESVSIARSYDGIADILLLDSLRPGDIQMVRSASPTVGRSTRRLSIS